MDYKVILTRPVKFMPFAWFIMLWTNAKYSHVALVAGEFVIQASHGYVNVWHIDNFLKENKIVHEASWPEFDAEWIKKQLGKKYSILQILKIGIKDMFGLKMAVNGDHRYICSEFAGKGMGLKDISDYTDPVDIYKILVGMGKL